MFDLITWFFVLVSTVIAIIYFFPTESQLVIDLFVKSSKDGAKSTPVVQSKNAPTVEPIPEVTITKEDTDVKAIPSKNIQNMLVQRTVSEDLNEKIKPSNHILGLVSSMRNLFEQRGVTIQTPTTKQPSTITEPAPVKPTFNQVMSKFLQDEQQYLQALQNKIFPEKIKKYTKTFEKKAKEQDFKPLNALFASMEKLGSDDDPDHLALFKLQKHLTKPIDLENGTFVNDLGDYVMRFVMNTLIKRYLNGILSDYQQWRPQIQKLLMSSDKILKTYLGKDVITIGDKSYTFEEFIALASERLTYYVITLRDQIYTPFFDTEQKRHAGVKFSNAIEKLEKEMNTRMNMLEAIYHMNKFYEIQYHWELDDAECIPKFVYASKELVRVTKKSEQVPCKVYLFQDLLILASINQKPHKKMYHLNGISVHSHGNQISISLSPTKTKVLIVNNPQAQDELLQILTTFTQPNFFDDHTTQLVARHLRSLSNKEDSIQSYYGQPLEQLYREKKYEKFTQPDNDTNIRFQSDANEKYQTRIIRCASLPKLVEYLTHPSRVDNQFLYSFILTYHSFTTVDEFLILLAERYETPPKQNCTTKEFQEFKNETLFPIRLRVCQVLKYWIENHAYDFRNENTRRRYSDLIEHHIAKTNFGHLADNLRMALDTITKKRDTFSRQRMSSKLSLSRIPLPPALYPNKLRSLIKKEELSGVLEWPSLEIARQMTLIEFEIFEKIQPKECLSQAWNKPNKEEKAPNITKMIQRTNRVVLWVAAEILQYEKQARRTYAIRKFIKLATALRKLNNFNACKEIVGGLRSIPVSRLTKSWEALPTKFQTEFHELEELMHQKKSYGNMRVALKNTNTCALPYIGMFLTDLTFVEDGNKDITDGLINFFKRQKYAVVIREMLRLQSERYAFTVVPDLQTKLLNIQEYNEDKLLEISYKYEPKK